MINFLAAAYGTVSDIEILFSLISFIGAAFSIFSSYEAIKDYQALNKAKIGNGRRLLAWTSVQTEIARVIIQLIFLTIGILAATIAEMPPQLHLPLEVVIFGFIFRWGLILSSLLLMYKSILAYLVRQKLREERIEHENNHNGDVDPLELPLSEPGEPLS